MDEAQEIHQVVETKLPELDNLKVQLQNLQSQVSMQNSKFVAFDEELPLLKQHLQDAAETLTQALNAFKDVEGRVNGTIDYIATLTPRIETLERKCQSLSDRPMIRNCKACGAKLDQRATQCPKCSEYNPLP